MPARYVPEAGDIVWITFDPQVEHEQSGHRPAVVLSRSAYNRRSGLIVCCPTTTKIKRYPFEVLLSGQPASVALADQVKSFDWETRQAKLKGRVSDDELAQIRAKLRGLIG